MSPDRKAPDAAPFPSPATPSATSSATPSATSPATPSANSTDGLPGPAVRRRQLLRGLLGLGTLGATGAALAACSTPGTGPIASAPSAAGYAAGSSAPPAAGSPDETDSAGLGHVHAAAFAPNGRDVLLATHTGLYTLRAALDRSAANPTSSQPAPADAKNGLTRIGAQIDLMGFTIAPDGTYLASGHPDPGLDLPLPLGLARSTDRGRSWQVLSRGGESDFHALTASRRGAMGYDGTLRFSPDLRTWQTRSIPAPPRMLSAHPETGHVLATTEAGLMTSVDDGQTWRTLAPPALVSDAVWADADTIVGITTGQVLVLSPDRGATWQSGPGPVASPPGLGPLQPVAALTSRSTPGARTATSTATSPATSAATRAGTTLTPARERTHDIVVVFGDVPILTRDLGATSALLR